MPHTPETLIQKLVAAGKRDDHNEIIEICTQIINHPDTNDEQRAKAYNGYGIAHSHKGEFDRAIQDYDKAIEANPKYADVYNNRGIVYNNKGEFDRAIQDYSKAIELNPKHAKIYLNRGIAYADKREHDHAIQDYSKAIELKSDYVEAYYNRGIVYADKRKYDHAIQDYDKAIELNPKHAEAYNNRGVAYGYKSERNRALEDFTKAVELKTDYTEALFNRVGAIVLNLAEAAQEKISGKYEKKSKEQQEKIEREERLETPRKHTPDDYRRREDLYKIQKEEMEKERTESLKKLSEYGFIGYSMAIFLYLLFGSPGFLTSLPLILAVTLMLYPQIWKIRILNRRIEKLWILEENSYSNFQLSAQLNESSDPEIKKELLKKLFDRHDKRGGPQLIVGWDRTTEKDSNDNIIQTIANRTPKEKE